MEQAEIIRRFHRTFSPSGEQLWRLNTSGGFSESGWSGSGGGISLYESKPPYRLIRCYRDSIDDQTDNSRCMAFDADPNTGGAGV